MYISKIYKAKIFNVQKNNSNDKMDNTDRKIMAVLDKNPRATQSEISKQLKISQQVANYRIKKLFSSGTINKASALIDFMGLGYSKYILFFRLNQYVKVEKDLFDFFSKNPNIWWAAKVGSFYDVMVMTLQKDFVKFESFVESISDKFPNCLGEHVFLHVIHHELYDHLIFDREGELKRRMGYCIRSDPVKIKKEDYALLDILANDCRRSSLAIGNELGLSYKTVQNKIKSLEKDNIIVGYRLFHNVKPHKAYLILISYSQFSKEKEQKLLSEAYQVSQITMWWKVFGRYNLILHARCHSYEELQDMFTKIREKHGIIKTYRLIPVFKDILINAFPHAD